MDIYTCSAVCTHECVVVLAQKIHQLEREKMDAEHKLEQYRKAVRPFLRDCENIVALAEEIREGKKND
jgi:hypothetical protein